MLRTEGTEVVSGAGTKGLPEALARAELKRGTEVPRKKLVDALEKGSRLTTTEDVTRSRMKVTIPFKV